jgi:hypothetical protein
MSSPTAGQRISANGVKTDSHDPPEGREDTQTEDNVVRLPREWLGPREDLVRIGVPDADATAPSGAEDFWGEGSSDLQSALVGPPADENRVDVGTAAETDTGDPDRARYGRRSWPARTPALITTATVALILAVVVIPALGGHRLGPPHPQIASLLDLPRVMESDARHLSLKPARGNRVHRRSHAARPRASRSGRAPSRRSTSSTLIASSSNPHTSATYSEASSVSSNSSQIVSSTPAQAASVQPSQPAFGANGSLGPGHGAANTQ